MNNLVNTTIAGLAKESSEPKPEQQIKKVGDDVATKATQSNQQSQIELENLSESTTTTPPKPRAKCVGRAPNQTFDNST